MFKNKRNLQNFFKTIIHNIFKIIYGEINGKISPADDQSVKFEKVQIDKIDYNIYFCSESSLYTDRIHDTAIIKNNKIINGPSFQLRNNKNVSCENNSVFEKGTPRFKKKISGKVLSLLTGGGGNTNYWHWLFDVLPRLMIMDSLTQNYRIDYYLLPELSKKFQYQTLDILNIPKSKRLSSKHFRHIYSDEIIVTSHPYTLLNDPDLDSLNIPKWIIKYIKEKFLKPMINDKMNLKNYPSKIFINRKDGTSFRYIINENEVEKRLLEKGFTSVTLSEYEFIDQVALFYNVKQIVGLHGAGFANIIFCKPNTKVIELKPKTAGDVIKNLALENHLNYKDISPAAKTINFNNQAGDIEIDLQLLNKTIDEV